MNIRLQEKDKLFYIKHLNGSNIILESYKNSLIPLTKANATVLYEGLQDYLKATESVIRMFKIIPNNVIYYENQTKIKKGTIVWYQEPIKKFFRHTNAKQEMVFYHPGYVFKYDFNSLNIYAVKTNELTENTPLFKAPVPNIYASGNMCFGNIAKNRDNYGKEVIEANNEAFYDTKFSHSIDTIPVNGKVKDVLKKMTENESFPLESLVPAKMKLSNIL